MSSYKKKGPVVRNFILGFGVISFIALIFLVRGGESPGELTATTVKQDTSKHFSHAQYDSLLKKYVDENGMVDYKSFAKAKGKLDSYLKDLSAHPPDPDTWSRDERLAYWINAYNAFTIQLILNHYPIKSIKDIVPTQPGVNTPWEIKFIHIGGQTLSLDDIEHNILREKFGEPRIHFALVCAAGSCPSLRQEAYTGKQLEQQLDSAGYSFLHNPEKNKIYGSEKVSLSPIFKWYAEDFKEMGGAGGVIEVYSDIQVEKDSAIHYNEYDWSLNEQ